MAKIILTVGISNSGKSIFAHNEFAKNPEGIVVVNRDKIRELLFGYSESSILDYYNRPDIYRLEKVVTKYEDTIIYEAINENKDIIVDATHLDRKYLERFKYWNIPVEVKFFDISLADALIRNEKRVRKVPADIIVKQLNKYVNLRRRLEDNPINFDVVLHSQHQDKIPCVIFDIDGTLAHKGDRSPYDWMKVGEDSVDYPTAFLNTALDRLDGIKVIICTGRDGICLDETEKWLIAHGIEYDKIYIRNERDMRPDWVVKEEMWVEIMKKHNIISIIDDRMQVVRRARMLGFKVFQVEYNNF